MSALIDMTGQRFGGWVVLGRAPNSKQGKTKWRVKCDCGLTRISHGSALRDGLSKQCRSCAYRKHGKSGTKLYSVWQRMLQRCANPGNDSFMNYGERGIVVCNEWLAFSVFYGWAQGHGYRRGLTIERIDNDGDYEPSNCRWATRRERNRNTRRNVHITIHGVTKLLCDWSAISGIGVAALRGRLARGWPHDNLMAPVNEKFNWRARLP